MKIVKTKKTKLEIPIPDGWHEVSFEKGFQIVSTEMKDIDVLSLISGIPVKTLNEQTDLESISYFVNSLLFLKTLPLKRNPEFPSKVNGVELPWINYGDKFDLGKCTVEQVEEMKQLIRETNPKNDIETFEIFPTLCSIYLYPILTNKPYDHDEAFNYVPKVEQIDFKTIINMGSFFLLKLSVLESGQANEWQIHRTAWRKFKRALSRLTQRLVFMAP
ncbi:MAG: hypothetical protein HRU26_17525 [Psychroserpens sp.]|nr:hypothetical protein [Psychroserpens sp.]